MEQHKPESTFVEEKQGEVESQNETGETFAYSPEEETRAVRRLDRVLMPTICGIYILSYIDRGNIGNAKTAGMTTDLKINSNQYAWLISIYYIAYICFHWTILMWKAFDAPTWVMCITFGFGIMSVLQAVAQNWAGMMAIRFFLGVFEAGYGPGVAFFLSWFYNRSEMALRYGLFIGASALANAFASSLAYGIVQAKNTIAVWRLLFIIEGVPTIALAGVIYFYIPRGPNSVRFLSKRDTLILADRAVKARGEISNEGKPKLAESLKVLLDYKCWCQACIIFCLNSSFGSLPAFLPTIVTKMGFTSIRAQGLSAPPYLAAYVCCISLALISDKLKNRGLCITVFAWIGAAGYLMERLATGTSVRYGAVYMIACGVFPATALTFTWVTDNQMTSSRRGAGLILFGMIGQSGNFLGARVFPDEDGPYYRFGMATMTGLLFAAGFLALCLSGALRYENRRMRKSGETDSARQYIL